MTLCKTFSLFCIVIINWKALSAKLIFLIFNLNTVSLSKYNIVEKPIKL